jgi:hypothetical protein
VTWPAVCWPTVAATGHRPQHFPSPAVRRWTIDTITSCVRWLRDEAGATVLLSGMALGVDQWWAAAGIEAGLTLGAHVPCPPNPQWTPAQLREYRRLLDHADPAHSRTYADTFTRTCMDDRNRGMIAAADALVCVWMSAKRRGGTYNAIRDARRIGLAGLHIDPDRASGPKRDAIRFGIPTLTS